MSKNFITTGIQKLDFGHCGIEENVRGTFSSRSRSSEFLAGARDVFVNTFRSEDENYEGNPTPDKVQFLSHGRYTEFRLKERLEKAKSGDYIVAEANKMIT